MSINHNHGVLIIEGHVQGLSNMRSVGQYGIPIWLIDTKKCIAQYSKYCNRFLICPEFYSDEFTDFLIETAKSNNLKNWLLLPSNDHAVYSISKQRKRLQEYYKLITPAIETIDNIYDKIKLLKLAERIQIPIPKTYVYDDLKFNESSCINYPVLTKGRNGLSFYKKMKKKVLVSKDKNELLKKIEMIKNHMTLDRVFTQEIIRNNGSNKTTSFTSFSVNGEIKTHWMGEKIREHPIQFGTATYVRSVYEKELLGYSCRLIQELNYTGICEIEYLKDPLDEQYKLIEINPRTWLWVGLAAADGINYAKIAYDFVHGKPIDYPKTYNVESYWYNPFTDWVYSLKAIVTNKLSIKAFIRSICKKKENALFKAGDIKPGLFYIMNVFNFYKNR